MSARRVRYEIGKGLPIPKGTGCGGFRPRPAIYPLEELEIGESFLVPDLKKGRSARAIARFTARKNGRKFASRKTSEGIRIWRTA